jgi:hypothetical protein
MEIFSLPYLFDNLTKKITIMRLSEQTGRSYNRILDPKKIKMEWGDIQVRTTGDLTAILWTDRRNSLADEYL